MVYSHNFVGVVKVDGKILRESGGHINNNESGTDFTIPFGSEYSILLKNLDSVRVIAKIEIDGQKVNENGFVIGPNSDIEIERFVKDLSKGNRFKFIERTEEVESGRGVKIEDGIIRIEYAREKILPAPVHVPVVYDKYCHLWPYDTYHPWYSEPHITYTCTGSSSSGILRSANSGGGTSTSVFNCTNSAVMDSCNDEGERGRGDIGITVPGSISNQQFTSVYSFPTEEAKVLILRLRGQVGSKPVKRAVTVDTKIVCSTCKKSNSSRDKFCPSCGTSLELV